MGLLCTGPVGDWAAAWAIVPCSRSFRRARRTRQVYLCIGRRSRAR